jgi:transketolase
MIIISLLMVIILFLYKGDTALGFTEDVIKRFEAHDWHTIVVNDGDNDLDGLAAAIEQAKAETEKPSLIKVRTTIGFGSLNQGEEKVHGSPLDKDDIIQLKKKFGFNPEEHFTVPADVKKFWDGVTAKNAASETEWNKLFAEYSKAFPTLVLDFFNI